MSDTVKLIIEIPEEEYKRMTEESIYSTHVMICAIQNGIQLDDVKTKIEKLKEKAEIDYGHTLGFDKIYVYKICLDILDNISKTESEETE